MIIKLKLTGKKENSNLLFLTYLIYIKNNNKTNKKTGHCVGVYCTSATEKVRSHVRFYTKNGQFHPLIAPPTTELKIR